MNDEAVRVVVAGVGGGVGTTTVAALVFDGMREGPHGAPRLLDHSGGDLGARLPHGDDARRLDDRVAVHDAGRHAMRIGPEVLDAPHDLLVIAAPLGPLGLADARDLMGRIDERHPTTGRRRTVLVLNAPFGPARDDAAIEALRRDYERRLVLALPRDLALAAGGRIALPRLAAPTRRVRGELVARVADLVARHRGSAALAR